MNEQIKYIACFVDADELLEKTAGICTQHLDKMIAHPHVTFAYMPEQVDTSLFGTNMTVTICGYANDGKNEGVKVTVSCDNPVLSLMFSRIPVPHITISVARDSEPVLTGSLKFDAVEPIVIHGVFGGFCIDENRKVTIQTSA